MNEKQHTRTHAIPKNHQKTYGIGKQKEKLMNLVNDSGEVPKDSNKRYTRCGE